MTDRKVTVNEADQRAEEWLCDLSLCDKPAEFVCRGETDIFRACGHHADRYPRVTVEEYRHDR